MCGNDDCSLALLVLLPSTLVSDTSALCSVVHILMPPFFFGLSSASTRGSVEVATVQYMLVVGKTA